MNGRFMAQNDTIELRNSLVGAQLMADDLIFEFRPLQVLLAQLVLALGQFPSLLRVQIAFDLTCCCRWKTCST
jgi:hypothetical protein